MKIPITIIFILIFATTHAQQLTSPAGMEGSNGTYSFSWSMGELVTTTGSSSGLVATQGYQQPGSINGESNILLNVTVLLEGAFNGANMNTSLNAAGLIPLTQPYNTPPWNYAGTESVVSIPSGVVDWVLVELRQATEPTNATGATIFGIRAAFLKSDGTVVDLDGTSPVQFIEILSVGNNLYVIIRHRNHLAIMSNTGASLNGSSYQYDFTSDINNIYGGSNGYKYIGNNVLMVSGDANHDGSVTILDYNSWAINYGKSNNYYNEDSNFDSNISILDYNNWALSYGLNNDVTLKSASVIPTYYSNVPN